MPFHQLFMLSFVVTVSVVVVTVFLVRQETRSVRRQRQQPRMVLPSSSRFHEEEDGGQALAPSPELLHAVRRLG